MKSTKNNIVIGIFVMIGIVLFVSTVYYIGSQKELFGSKIELTAEFQNVSGLQPGNNVRFSGIKVGIIERIEIASDSLARVYILVDEKSARFIKKDAYVSIASDGLMGNKILSISPGSVSSAAVKSGDKLSSKEPLSIDEVITSVKSTSDNAEELAQNLLDITESIKQSEGLIGKLISDDDLAMRVDRAVASVEGTSKNAQQITQEIEKASNQLNKGNGLITKLLYEDQWSKEVSVSLDSLKRVGTKLSSSSREFNAFIQKLNDDDGAIDKLVSDSSVARDLEQLIENMRTGTEDLDKAVDKVNKSWLLNLFSGNNKEEKDN